MCSFFGYNFLVMVMERKNGYLILDNQKMFYKENQAVGCFWYLIDGKQYMFKSCEPLFCYMELFYEQVARHIQISTVHYDLAKSGLMTGVLTESFNPNLMKEVYLKDILEKFYNEVVCLNTQDYPHVYFVENTYNLEDLWSALDYYYLDREDKASIVSHLMNQIVDSFLLQICTENIDLHYMNLVVLDGESPTLAPNFDYGQCGFVFHDAGTYHLQVSPLSFSETNNAQSIILEFLGLSSLEFRELLQEKVNLMPDFMDVCHIIEQNTGTNIPKDIQENLLFYYKDSKENLLKIVETFEFSRGK